MRSSCELFRFEVRASNKQVRRRVVVVVALCCVVDVVFIFVVVMIAFAEFALRSSSCSIASSLPPKT